MAECITEIFQIWLIKLLMNMKAAMQLLKNNQEVFLISTLFTNLSATSYMNCGHQYH